MYMYINNNNFASLKSASEIFFNLVLLQCGLGFYAIDKVLKFFCTDVGMDLFDPF